MLDSLNTIIHIYYEIYDLTKGINLHYRFLILININCKYLLTK